MFFFIWYGIEIFFFKLFFNESIDHCVTGKQSMSDIIKEYRKNNSISGKTMFVRILLYLINFGGFYLLCSPLMKYMAQLPLIAFFLKDSFLTSTVYVTAMITLSVQLFFISIAWLIYRPVTALTLFLLSASIISSFFYLPPGQKGLSFDEVNKLYVSLY